MSDYTLTNFDKLYLLTSKISKRHLLTKIKTISYKLKTKDSLKESDFSCSIQVCVPLTGE